MKICIAIAFLVVYFISKSDESSDGEVTSAPTFELVYKVIINRKIKCWYIFICTNIFLTSKI